MASRPPRKGPPGRHRTLIARGVHPKAVSEHLGHSSIAITMDLYGHLYPDHEELIVAALEDTYSQSVANSDSQRKEAFARGKAAGIREAMEHLESEADRD